MTFKTEDVLMRWAAFMAGSFCLGSAGLSAIRGGAAVEVVVPIAVAAVTLSAVAGRLRSTAPLSAIIAVALAVIGELYGLALSADRILAARDRQQVEAAVATATHEAARRRYQSAVAAEVEARQAGLATFDARVVAAQAAVARAQVTAGEKAAERGCAAHCRALLEGVVASAQAELAAARADREQAEATREGRISAAAQVAVRSRLELEAAPKPVSGTPLADRLGYEPAHIDLGLAALGALALNLSGIFLVGYATSANPPQSACTTKLGAGVAHPALAPGEILPVLPQNLPSSGRNDPAPNLPERRVEIIPQSGGAGFKDEHQSSLQIIPDNDETRADDVIPSPSGRKGLRLVGSFIPDFVAGNLAADEDASVPAAALYARYEDACAAAGFEPVSQRAFGVQLSGLGFKRAKSMGLVRYVGVRLRETADVRRAQA